MTVSEKHIKPPFGDQRFDSFDQWVNRASSWLTCHAEYNNTEHGDKNGWRGHHFAALCFDSLGRRCTHGAHFQRARDENAFPVWWIWPDQIIEALASAEREGREDERKRCAEIARQAVIRDADDYWDKRNVAAAVAESILSQANTHSPDTSPGQVNSAGSVPPPADPATLHASRNGEGA